MSQITSGQYFDLSFLLEIADGSNEFIVESIEMFLQQTPELLGNITDALTAGDYKGVASFSHKLKPNLGFFGMTACQTLMQEIEATAKSDGNFDAIPAKLAEAKAMIEPSLVELTVIMNQKKG